MLSESNSPSNSRSSQFLATSPNTFVRTIKEHFHKTRATTDSILLTDPEAFGDMSDPLPTVKVVNQGAVENVQELSGTHVANNVEHCVSDNNAGVGVGVHLNVESEPKTEVTKDISNYNVKNTDNLTTKTINNNIKNIKVDNVDSKKRKKKLNRLCYALLCPFVWLGCWRKSDRVLPVSKTDITQTYEDRRQIKKKRRRCCLIILCIIIILLLLANMVALDVISFRPQVISPNPAEGANSSNPPPQVKNAVCAALFSSFSLQPQAFPCEFCIDSSDVAANITDFCVVKGIWSNAFNATSLESGAGWMKNTNFCKWVGVSCDPAGRIVGLELIFPNVPNIFLENLGNLGNLEKLTTLKIVGNAQVPNGAFPASIFQLKNLAIFRLEQTALANAADSFDKLSSIKSLQLIRNPSLAKTVPSSIASLSLSTLTISGQNIAGAIPDFIGNSATLQSSLQSLDLSFNQFSGTVPASLLQLKALTSLLLGGNQLSGSIPVLPTSLTVLDLNTNSFTGSIPPSLTQMSELTFLSLRTNLLTGPIPPSITQLTKLTDLSLQNNKLTGTIPDGIGNMIITKLNLGLNTLSGQVPTSICQKAYSTCDLSGNSLTSPIKCTICLV